MTPQEVHDFNKSLIAGEKGEAYLDTFFARWYVILPATRRAQREGIDRYFTRKAGNPTEKRKVWTVEYKTDARAGQTGNAFVETVSVDGKKKGWAYTSRAEILVYRVTQPEAIYVIPMEALREVLPEWGEKYRTVTVQNATYTTHGILVPLLEFEQIALSVL